MKMIKKLLNRLVGDELSKLAGNEMDAVELKMVGAGLMVPKLCEDHDECCKCPRCC